MSVSPILSISTSIDDTSEKVVCKLCRRQFAKYTCPACNVPYCSITCFRSDVSSEPFFVNCSLTAVETHSQCSETFYKKELESGIKSEPSKTAGERSKMLELLKRFEEESVNEELGLQDDDDDESDLADRLSSVNLDTISEEELWSMLTQVEKDRFIKAVNDPSSEIAQRLLSRQELHSQLAEPWWTSLPFSPDDDTSAESYPPSTIDIPEALLKPLPNRPLLAYNLSAIGIAYAYIVRHFGLLALSTLSTEDADFGEAYKLISRLLPFLIDRTSKLVFPNLDAVVTDLASRFDSNTISPELLAALLEDAHKLMCPHDITDITPSVSKPPSLDILSQPHYLPLLVLSDLHHFFSSGIARGRVPSSLKHLTHKVVFYAAHVITMPTPLLRGLAHELKQKSVALRADSRN